MTDTIKKRLADAGLRVKPLEWSHGVDIALGEPYQIWSNNGGSGAPDDPLVHYNNFMAFDPHMNSLGEHKEHIDAVKACNDHRKARILAALEVME